MKQVDNQTSEVIHVFTYVGPHTLSGIKTSPSCGPCIGQPFQQIMKLAPCIYTAESVQSRFGDFKSMATEEIVYRPIVKIISRIVGEIRVKGERTKLIFWR